MPDKIQNNDFLVMGFSEIPDRKPTNAVLSGIKKRAAPRAARSKHLNSVISVLEDHLFL
jgi:hypothetical protein